MRNTMWLLAVLGWAIAGCGITGAGEMTNGVFSVTESKTLQVKHRGDLLIESDAINYLDGLEGADEVVTGKKGKTSVLNVLQKKHDAVQFRKEVALHADGHLELTVRMRIFPYKNTPDKKYMTYSFMVPAKTLDGAKFKALTGRIYKTKTVEGDFSANRKDGNIPGDRCRFIAFKSDKVSLVFDCNPYGLMSFQDYCMYGEPVGAWSVVKKGEHVVISFGQSARSYGGIFAGKILIYEGTYNWDERHPYRKWGYTGATPAMAQFTFGTAAETKGYAKADCAAYSAEKKWGWKKPSGLTMLDGGSPSVIANCVCAAGGTANTFLLDVTPGYYMTTIRVGHNTKNIGPFNILLNGKRCAKDVRVAAGKTKTLVLSRYVRTPERQLKIGFEGPALWAVRSIVAQTIIYQNEDYVFDRGKWVADGLFSPEIE